jgi:AcrR family transcriptional regulator
MSRDVGAREAGAQRTRKVLLAAAAQVFIERGVHAPIRDIAGQARVGVGTVYRHFPNRAELVIAVYRHQIDECVDLAEELRGSSEPGRALEQWVSAFVEFLVTKHGLGVALQSDEAGFHSLHALMLDKLVPACGLLVEAAVAQRELDPKVTAYALMRAVGNLCILGPGYEREDALAMVVRLLVGCRLTTTGGPEPPSSPTPSTLLG